MKFNWQAITENDETHLVPTQHVDEIDNQHLDIEDANDYINELRDQLAEEPLESFVSDFETAAKLINELESRIPEDD